MKVIREAFSYRKLVVFKIANGLFLVMAMAFLASTDGIDWGVLTPTQKARLIIFCVVAGGKFLEGFFDQSLSRLEQGKSMIPTGDTAFTNQPVPPLPPAQPTKIG
jgi:hypothetical protein